MSDYNKDDTCGIHIHMGITVKCLTISEMIVAIVNELEFRADNL